MVEESVVPENGSNLAKIGVGIAAISAAANGATLIQTQGHHEKKLSQNDMHHNSTLNSDTAQSAKMANLSTTISSLAEISQRTKELGIDATPVIVKAYDELDHLVEDRSANLIKSSTTTRNKQLRGGGKSTPTESESWPTDAEIERSGGSDPEPVDSKYTEKETFYTNSVGLPPHSPTMPPRYSMNSSLIIVQYVVMIIIAYPILAIGSHFIYEILIPKLFRNSKQNENENESFFKEKLINIEKSCTETLEIQRNLLSKLTSKK